ncbi:glucose-1-phosphate cytidylyltransferase [Campylobacter lanienae]|uniref:glucose-1-phosphate cytidylyltransferase n=1 Tax=Campylobacter lanienae TaxID=75658 RepID=UPI000BB43029|nr:glucose-1-phosphate cytidylyltransferase [Campylobacter lanienae]
MKVAILAGGLGTRLGEETSIKPKPMVDIGGFPILWHIMKIYSHQGFNDFVVLTGYKQEVIKDYFVNYYINNSDVTVDLCTNAVEVHQNHSEPFKVTMLYTGRNTLTAGRIERAREFLGNETFMLTYGDGVADIDIEKLIKCHKNSGKICTITAYQPEGKYGALGIEEDGTISSFSEKPKEGGAWINAGFMVCEPKIFDYFPENSDKQMFEKTVLNSLSSKGQLNAYKHTGFWHPMDMLKDKQDLNQMWADNKAPWKLWRG